jgi:hypothetical protein
VQEKEKARLAAEMKAKQEAKEKARQEAELKVGGWEIGPCWPDCA